MKTALLLAASLLAGAAQAQAVWRCGPDGRSYSATPCPEGRVVAVADPRSAADLAAGRSVASRETALARDLMQQRIERERDRDRQALAERALTLRTATPAPEKLRPAVTTGKTKKRQRPNQEAQLTPSRTATGGTSPAAVPASRRKTG